MLKHFSLPTGAKLFSGDFQDGYVSTLLENMYRAYSNDSTKYIWKKVFPEVAVKKPKAKIANLGMQAMAIHTTKKGWKGWANKIEFGVELKDEYSLEEHALYTDIYKSDIENADAPIDAQRDKSFILKGAYELSKEYACISSIFDDSIITNHVALTSHFDDDLVDPIGILLAQAKLLKDTCGSRPSLVVVTLDVMVAMINNAKVIDRFKYTTTPSVPQLTEQLKNVLGTEIAISESQKWNQDGDLEGTLDYLATDKIFMMYNEAPGIYSKGFGKTFTRKGGARVMSASYPVTDQIKNDLDSLVAVKDEYDMHIIDQKCARLITAVLTPES